MTIRVLEFSEVEPDRWDRALDRSPYAWLFHRATWIQLIADIFPDQRNRSFLVVRDSRDIAAVPAFAVHDRVWRVLPRLVYRFPLAGPALVAEAAGEHRTWAEVLMVLQDRARSDGADSVETVVHPLAPAALAGFPVNPLLPYGFADWSQPCWLLLLSGDPAVAWKAFDGRARNQVRQAEKEGVTVRRARGPEDVDAYYALHVETYARTGAPPFPKAYFQETLRRLPTVANFFFALDSEGQPIAAINVIRHGASAVYNSGCSSRRGQELRANHLLQWHAIRWLAQERAGAYLLGDAFPATSGKNAGLDLFKRSFGAEMRYSHRGLRVLRRITYVPSRWRSILAGEL
jgi:hypothetical protein